MSAQLRIGADAKTGDLHWRLVWWVITPYWLFMLSSRLLGFNMATALDPRIIIAPPQLRVVQHLILLPLLVLFLRYALLVGWPATQRWRAAVMQSGMAALFAFIARPVLVGLVAGYQGNRNLLDELFRSILSPMFSQVLWLSSFADFLLSYLGGLVLLLGVRAWHDARRQLTAARQLEGEWIRGRLDALQLRGNPHFVFGVLRDAAREIQKSPAVAEQLLSLLSRHLHRSLAVGGEELVPLRQELAAIEDYVAIQKLRFGGRVAAELTIDAAAEQCLVPNSVLQPIVEDVLIRSQSDGGQRLVLRIAVARRRESIEFSVLGGAATPVAVPGPPGPGIALLRERLSTLFGDSAERRVVTDSSDTVAARLELPFVTSSAAIDLRVANAVS